MTNLYHQYSADEMAVATVLSEIDGNLVVGFPAELYLQAAKNSLEKLAYHKEKRQNSVQLRKYWSRNAKIAGMMDIGYGRFLDKINYWANIAKQDVPGLKDSEIKIVQYIDGQWTSLLGIEFPSPNCPAGYIERERPQTRN